MSANRRAASFAASMATATALLLTGCATQAPQQTGSAPRVVERTSEEPGLSSQMAAAADTLSKMADLQNRLYKVASPLLIQNAELCKGQARNLLGFTAKNRWSYPGDYNEAAHVAFGMDERLQVTSVLAGSGAAKAGL